MKHCQATALLLAAFSLAAFAAPAGAQLPSCDVLKKLVKDAPAGFAAHRLKNMPGSAFVFQSSVVLPGQLCLIAVRPEDSSHLCNGAFLTAEVATTTYNSDLARLRACFPGMRELPPVPDGQASWVQLDRGVRLVQQRDGHELGVGLLVGRDERQKPTRYRIGFAVIWKKLVAGS